VVEWDSLSLNSGLYDPIVHPKVDRRKNVERKCHNKGQEKPGCSEKNSQVYLSTKNLAWIFLGSKASLSGDNPAPITHPVYTLTNGNKKGTVHAVSTNNLTFMSK